jgi:hypothetical protein
MVSTVLLKSGKLLYSYRLVWQQPWDHFSTAKYKNYFLEYTTKRQDRHTVVTVLNMLAYGGSRIMNPLIFNLGSEREGASG